MNENEINGYLNTNIDTVNQNKGEDMDESTTNDDIVDNDEYISVRNELLNELKQDGKGIDVVKAIIHNSKTIQGAMLRMFMPSIGDDLSITILPSRNNNKSVEATFQTIEGKQHIVIYAGSLFSDNKADLYNEISRVLLHEFLHSITADLINRAEKRQWSSNMTIATIEKNIYSKLNTLYNHARTLTIYITTQRIVA